MLNIKKELQYDPKFTGVNFKNNTTIKSYGCCVISAVMIINYYQDNTSNVIDLTKSVIKECTNSNGDFTYPKNFKINNMILSCEDVIDVSEQLDKQIPVITRIQKGNDSHYVVVNGIGIRGDLNTYEIIDPGYKTTTIGELIAKKGIGYKVTKKFIIKR